MFGTNRRQGMVETMAKQAARTVGSQIGRQILRGVLGGIFGGKTVADAAHARPLASSRREKHRADHARRACERLKAELDDLWRVRRPEVVKALAAAAAEGDRSENAEYTYRKKQLGEIDRRVRYLSKRLETLKVVERRRPIRPRSFSARGSRSRTSPAAK